MYCMVSRQFSTAATDATSLRFTFALDEVREGTPASEKTTACLSSLVDAVAEVSEVLAGARSWREYESKAKYTHFRISPGLMTTPLQSMGMRSETACACLAAANSMTAKEVTEVL